MSHMPRYGISGTVTSQTVGGRIVRYTATGAEAQTGFDIPIGAELASNEYDVSFYSAEGDIEIPAVWTEHPEAYTTTTFRMGYGGGALTAGGVYKFEITNVTTTTTTSYESDTGCECEGGGGTFFQYVADGTEGDTFTVDLPTARSDTAYIVIAGGGTRASQYEVDVPESGQTTTGFEVICGAAPAAGDVINFTIGDKP